MNACWWGIGQLRIPENDQGRNYLEEIVRVIDRGAALTQGLLSFSRKQVLSPKVLDLNTVIKEQLRMLRRLVPESIELKFTPGVELGLVRGDQNQIEQVVMNLVINARDAMPDGGYILIETENSEFDSGEQASNGAPANKKYVMVAVSDNGCGMDSATKAQIFEPFFTTKGQGKGTGLGLAVVSDIVKQSGGHTFVQSEVGLGTTFKFTFRWSTPRFWMRMIPLRRWILRSGRTKLFFLWKTKIPFASPSPNISSRRVTRC
jgi:signal transduction histidine kinase